MVVCQIPRPAIPASGGSTRYHCANAREQQRTLHEHLQSRLLGPSLVDSVGFHKLKSHKFALDATGGAIRFHQSPWDLEQTEEKLAASGAHSVAEFWYVYVVPTKAQDPRVPGRQTSFAVNNKEIAMCSLLKRSSSRVVQRAEFNSCGESSTTSTTYTGIHMRRYCELLRTRPCGTLDHSLWRATRTRHGAAGDFGRYCAVPDRGSREFWEP